MGHRLSRIYTRTGDDGTTGLADGRRVPKHDLTIAAIGAVDETNCAIGVVLAEPIAHTELAATLTRIQHELFDLGAELALPGHRGVGADHLARLEADLDALNGALPPLQEFVLPAGNRAASCCHLARAICRRAEREAATLAARSSPGEHVLAYLNRLSDYLFVAARTLAREGGQAEVLWRRE